MTTSTQTMPKMVAMPSSAYMAKADTHSIPVDAVLFDMDGTLIDSTPALVKAWKYYADKYNLDYDYIIEHCHGHRAVENMKRFIPSLTDEEAEAEAVEFENRIIDIAREAKAKGEQEGQITPIPGASNLINEIEAGKPKNDTHQRWAIVTSATAQYAADVLDSSGTCEPPKTFVAAEHVTEGKPSPKPYVLGAKLAGTDAARCLVIEDAPAGAVAGKRAGARVIGLRTTHDEAEKLWDADADFVVKDLSKVYARWEGKQLVIDVQSEKKPEPISAAL